MHNVVLSLIFLALALTGIVLKKTYFAVEPHELKRRAEKQDPDAAALYKAVAYNNSLRSILWLYIGLTAAASIITLAKVLPVWLSVLIVGPALWFVFSLVPASRVSSLGLRLTKLVTPPIAFLLSYAHPLVSRLADIISSVYQARKHTGIYERYDLIELLERQKTQADSRLSEEELEIIKRALTFGEVRVSQVLIPRKKVKTVVESDVIGPILINELHQTSQDHVLVKDKPKGTVVGTLAFKDLSVRSKGSVKDHMDNTLYYLHEEDSLSEALHAFFITNRRMFVVVNSFEEYVGIVTIEAILTELMGHIPGDDFEEYTNRQAVAKRHHKSETAEEAGDS